MGTYDSKLGDRLEKEQRQQERNAEAILEEIMGRQRWTPKVRDDLAAALAKVARGIPLRRPQAKRDRPTMQREAGE